MKGSKELISLIIGLGRIAYMMGQIIFGFGLIGFWFLEPLFSIYLMLVGIGIVFMTGQKVKNIQLIGIIRSRSGKKRRTPREEE